MLQHAEELDAAVAGAIRSRTLDENLAIINHDGLTAVAVQTVADTERDPHWQARQLLVDVQDGAGSVRMHTVVPRMSGTPGEVRWTGGELGQHNNEVYASELGLEAPELHRLRAEGVI